MNNRIGFGAAQQSKNQQSAWFDDASASVMALDNQRPKYVVYLIVMVFAAAAVWAHYSQLDILIRGQGTVIPQSQIQIVQNLEGGILAELNITVGDVVEPGDVLMTLDQTRFQTDLTEKQTQLQQLSFTINRLSVALNSISEISGGSVPITEAMSSLRELTNNSDEQLALLESELFALDNQLTIIDQQIEQLRQDERATNSELEFLQRSADLLNQEIELTEPLADANLVPEVDLIALRRQSNEIQMSISAARQKLPKVQTAQLEKDNQRVEVILTNRARWQSELVKAKESRELLLTSLLQAEDRLDRTQVSSPVLGTVKAIAINTIGGVVQPGMDLVEIVPIDDALIIEARIEPKDIAFLRPGLDAVIKFSAYDFSIYGGVQGQMLTLGTDTQLDEDGRPFYLARVEATSTLTNGKGETLPLVSGMQASVDIVTGQRSMLSYLLKPILRARENALNEL